nr:luminal-binding protein 5-like [Ipomoea batatas]
MQLSPLSGEGGDEIKGERSLTKDNRLLGNFDLTAIAIVHCALPSGQPKTRPVGRSEKITITNDKGRLSQE